MDVDPVRLLRRDGLGYTSSASEALEGEPEAVPERYQDELTRRATRRLKRRAVDEWRPYRQQIAGVVRAARAAPWAHSIAGSLRAIDRQLEQIDEKLARADNDGAGP